MISELRVGQQVNQDGSIVPQRATKDAATLNQDVHGRYFEGTYRGQSFCLHSGPVTVAAANNSPLTAATGQPIVGIYNPQNSGKVAVIHKLSAATTSGTPGGPLLWNYAINQVITAVNSGTITSNFVGSGIAPVCKYFANTATTGSTVGLLYRLAVQISTGAAASNTSPAEIELGGDIIVPPGVYLGLASTAAGTTHIVTASLIWEEVNL